METLECKTGWNHFVLLQKGSKILQPALLAIGDLYGPMGLIACSSSIVEDISP